MLADDTTPAATLAKQAARETTTQEAAQEAPKRVKRGMKFIGKPKEAPPGVPTATPFTWMQSVYWFGDFENRKKMVEDADAVWAWGDKEPLDSDTDGDEA